LEGFEASAAEIFDDLLKLRRVVVFFDESEDFFKKRPDSQQLETRTLGAFITSGMLPRLQRLREKRWVMFLLSTNSEIDELDEAVTRRGRFDFAQKIFHPTLDAQKRYIGPKTTSLATPAATIDEALSLHDKVAATEQDENAAKVSFAILDDFVNHLASSPPMNADDLSELLDKLVKRKDPPPLAHH
jgi:SpoVK/Ycf46/Vps4 family AAA+-type ATPase